MTPAYWYWLPDVRRWRQTASTPAQIRSSGFVSAEGPCPTWTPSHMQIVTVTGVRS